MKTVLDSPLFAAAFAALLAAVAVAEEPVPDFNSPEVSASTGKGLLAPQVQSFLDGAETLTHDDALAAALGRSTDIQTAELKLRNMIESLDQARYSYYPEFRIEVSPVY